MMNMKCKLRKAVNKAVNTQRTLKITARDYFEKRLDLKVKIDFGMFYKMS